MEKSSFFSEADFTQVFYDEIINPFLTPSQKKLYTLLEEQNLYAHHKVKQGGLAEGQEIFIKIEHQLANHDYSPLLKALLQEAYYPKKAYYYYKLKKFNAAEYCTQKSLALNEYLKKILKKNDLLVFIQIQQYINLSKIFNAEGENCKSFDIIFNLLRFLFLNELNLKYLDKTVHLRYLKYKVAMSYTIIFEAIILLKKTSISKQQIDFRREFVKILQEIHNKLVLNSKRDNMILVFIGFISILLNTQEDLKHKKNHIEEFCKKHVDMLFADSLKILQMFSTN